MQALVKQLGDPDPAKRKQAIIALGNTKDPRALRPLGDVYKNDPDPALRELALKAGSFIKKHSQAEPPPQPAGGGFGWSTATPEPARAPHEAGPLEVSARDRDRAQMYLDRAVSYHMTGDKARVAENLMKALQLNPNLRKDTVAAGLATETMGRPMKLLRC